MRRVAAEVQRARRLLVADWVFSRESVGQEAMAMASALCLFDAEHEKRHVERVLKLSGYHKSRAAELLGISRPTLDKKIKDYGIQFPKDE